ncbi:MAG: nucleosidase [Paenibacillus sp.]|nr:nucleosidase [Paenibacillus sp.]
MWNKIGLIGAMAEEIERIEERLSDETVTDKAGIRFREGTFCGKRVVLCKSGVGKVNAAATTQILIDRFGVDAIIFTGVAGALDPSLDIGDIVISTDCQQHDMDVTPLGFARGVIPYSNTSVFPAEQSLVKLAAEASTALAQGRTVQGRVLSGDQFIADRDTVKLLHEQLGGACTEMEGSAVAQVCAMNGVPYVVIRSMSDKADGSAHVNFAEFAVQSADRSFRIVEHMVQAM